MSPVDIEQFRLEDYKLKLAYLDAHSTRMWTRFNYFVTIEAGLIGLFAIASFNQLAPWAVLVESVISVAWWAVGARDRFLWRAARSNVEKAAQALRVAGNPVATHKQRPDGYIPVGELKPFADELHKEPEKRDFLKWLGAWGGARNTRLGVTVLPVVIPASAIVLWWLLSVVFLVSASTVDWLASALVLPLVALLIAFSALRHDTQICPPPPGNDDENPPSTGWLRRLTLGAILLACVALAGCAVIVISAAINLNGANHALTSVLLTLTGVLVVLGIIALLFHLVSRRIALASAAAILALSLGVDVAIEPTITIGERGPRGYTGHKGSEGREGQKGKEGKRGKEGKKGQKGKEGKRGRRGERGPRGYSGGS